MINIFRCLIIDDDKFERDGLRYMIDLLKLPLIVTDVRNGKLGLERLKETPFDLVITDIKMPVMDGMIFLEKAKKIQPDCVYIIYSGYSDFVYAKKAIELKVLDFLVKPVSDEEFLKVMNRGLLLAKEKRLANIRYGLECLKNQNQPQELPDVHGRLFLFQTEDWKNSRSFFEEREVPVIEWKLRYYLGYLEDGENLEEKAWKENHLNRVIFSRGFNTWEGMQRACDRLQNIALSNIFRERVFFVKEEEIDNLPEFTLGDLSWDKSVCYYLEDKQSLDRNVLEKIIAKMPMEQKGLAERIRGVESIDEIIEVVTGYENKDEVVYHIRKYIKKHYAEELSVDLLADIVALTPTYLCTLFKKQTGVTLIHYLTQYRIEKAIELLEEDTYKTSEVARLVGYHNLSYFNLVFKERTGKTPGQYRKEKRYQR